MAGQTSRPLQPKIVQSKSTRDVLSEIRTRLGHVLWGKSELIELSIATFLAGGHLLLEGPPGTGKTSLAHGLARVFGGTFRRIQMTSDLLPSDIVGILRLKPGFSEFEFRQGPIFTNFLLADELNRTGPKTQSALLEAMAERTVTVDGVVHALPNPFFVVATQNPIEFQGVYPLAESQLDRFMLHLSLDTPAKADEFSIYKRSVTTASADIEPVVDAAGVLALQREVDSVHVEDTVLEYVLALVDETRHVEGITHGASVRGGLQFIAATKAFALLKGRDFVLPDDVRTIAGPALAHRLCFADDQQGTLERHQIIKNIVERVRSPK